MTDQQVQALVVFFQLALLNQGSAEEAAQSAYLQISSQAKAKASEPFDVLFVRYTDRILRTYRKPISYKKPNLAKSAGKTAAKQSSLVNDSHSLDLSPWRDYFKSAHGDEVAAMIWSQVLKIPDAHIAQALELSVGTVRHRLSRGLRALSEKLEIPQSSSPVRRPWN